MSEKEKAEKLKEIKFELVRANVTANKSNAKTKELKRAISRLLTDMNAKNTCEFNKTSKKKSEEELKKQ